MARGIALDAAGSAYISGSTGSFQFPTTPGSFRTTNAGGINDHTDAFVAKIAAPMAPRVVSTIVNDGAAQRSRVTSLQVTFSAQVSFAGPVANAFTLMRTGGASVNFQASASVINGVTVVTLNNFTGAETDTFGSLNDGRFTLTALASQITANGQQMGSNYTFGDAQGLYRLFGDVNGDQTVNGFDLGFFRNAFGTQAGDANYLSYFDLNGDGVINGFDLGQFRTRFGTMLP
jgi:Dockerin type I domain